MTKTKTRFEQEQKAIGALTRSMPKWHPFGTPWRKPEPLQPKAEKLSDLLKAAFENPAPAAFKDSEVPMTKKQRDSLTKLDTALADAARLIETLERSFGLRK
jgi:hypothetical protein